MWKRYLSLVLALATLGCESSPTPPSPGDERIQADSAIRILTARRSGEPVPGALLSLYLHDSLVANGVSDGSGHYVFRGLPTGSYRLEVAPPDRYAVTPDLMLYQSSVAYIEQLTPTSGALPPVRVTLYKQGTGSLAGRVVDTNGAPLAGIVVKMYSFDCAILATFRSPCSDPSFLPGQQFQDTTDAAGQVMFANAPFGRRILVADRPVPYRDFVTFRDSISKGVGPDTVEAGTSDTLTIVFAKCTGQIRVRVEGDAGEPIPNVLAAVYTSETERARSLADADGRVTFTEQPCATLLGVILFPPIAGHLVPPPYIRGVHFVDGILLTNGGIVDVVLKVPRA